MSYLSSNVPCKIFLASLGVDILRIGRITTDFSKFKSLCETLISKMISEGAMLKSIERCLCKIYGRNSEAFVKFANTCENFINVLLL